MQINRKAMMIATLGLLFLGACSDSQKTATMTPVAPSPESQPATSNDLAPSPNSPVAAKQGMHGGQGGQVIESGPYHLELITVNEADGTHIDFFLQKGDDHVTIPNAKVMAQVLLPDGSQKALDMKYDAADKHYYAVLPGNISGEYRVVILSNIQGEKVNARYSFKR